MNKISLSEGPLAPAFQKLVGSLAGPNPSAGAPDESGRVAGFWLGLWHGMIAPLTFLISLFNDKVHVYEVHNNGKWYLFGFLLGLGMMRGGGGRSRPSRRPKAG